MILMNLIKWNFYRGAHTKSRHGVLPACQSSGGYGDTQPNYVGLGETDGILCCHRAPGFSSLGHLRFKDMGSRLDPAVGTRRDPVPTCDQRTIGGRGGHVRRPQTGCLPTETKNQDWDMDHCEDVHSERNGDGGSGMEICSINLLWNRAPRPPLPLRWMKLCLLYLSCPGLKEARIHHNSS